MLATLGEVTQTTPAGADPVRRPNPPADNRWQRGEVVDALYLADGEACVWAEWYRHLAEAAIPPSFALPRDLWQYEVTDLEVADLSDPDRLAVASVLIPTGRSALRAEGALRAPSLHRS